MSVASGNDGDPVPAAPAGGDPAGNPGLAVWGGRLPGWLPALLGFLTAVGPMSTDMYLPAFPAIEAGLHAPPGSAQVTLATWFVGLALGQITQGTLSDRFGRRKPLIAGTLVYTLGSVGCALSTDLFWLSAFRFASALGGSASMVVPRAMVRDLADGHEAVRLMSRLMLVMGVTPILAPTLGGLVLSVASWHVIFWVAAGYGAACTALVWRNLPDTLPAAQRVALGPVGLLARYLSILRDRSFHASALVSGSVTFAMFAYVGGSPPVFIGLYGLSPPQYGMLFGTNASFYILASQLNSRAVRRFGLSRVMTGAAAGFLVSAAMAMAVAWSRTGHLLVMLLPLTAMWSCLGFLSPSATVSALSRQARRAASASALMGTMAFMLGAVSSVLMGALMDGTARPMAFLLLVGALGAVLANRARPDVSAPDTPAKDPRP